jgi:gas vesicle protein
MKAQVVTGSKQEIARTVAQISGEVREAIVFVEEPSDSARQDLGQDIFAEMEPFTVRTGGADYSREALYSRMDSE